MRVITKCKLNCTVLQKVIWLNVTALEKAAVESLIIMCADENMRQCNPIIEAKSVNYKEQVVITGIKWGMQCSMCQVLLHKRKNSSKKWPKNTLAYAGTSCTSKNRRLD